MIIYHFPPITRLSSPRKNERSLEQSSKTTRPVTVPSLEINHFITYRNSLRNEPSLLARQSVWWQCVLAIVVVVVGWPTNHPTLSLFLLDAGRLVMSVPGLNPKWPPFFCCFRLLGATCDTFSSRTCNARFVNLGECFFFKNNAIFFMDKLFFINKIIYC